MVIRSLGILASVGLFAAVVGTIVGNTKIESANLDLTSENSTSPFISDVESALQEANVEYNGQFIMARIRYESGGGLGGFGRRGGGDPPWHHDYPRGERNLMQILEGTTFIDAYRLSSNIFWADDPELMKFPVVYFSEPGRWSMPDDEIEGLRNYMLKGGFIIFDDFGGQEWWNFLGQLDRALPGVQPIELEVSHPIFDSFFAINDLFYMINYRGVPQYFGIFEDNDPDKAMYAIVNYNNDIAEYWEWSDVGRYAVDQSNEAYKLGVNYIVYALTH